MRHILLLATICIAATVAAMAGAPACAQDQPSETARLATRFDAQAIGDVFPPLALAKGLGGSARLRCAVAVDGAGQCGVESETPAGFGFGAAALSLLKSATFTPARSNGHAIASSVLVPVTFVSDGQVAFVMNELNVGGIRGASRPADTPDATNFYPSKAHSAGVDGQTLLACAVRANKRLDCAVEIETPTDFGFGERSLYLASTISAPMAGPGARFRLPFRFSLRNANEPEVRVPLWSNMPSAARIAAEYPRQALRQGVEGSVLMACKLLADGNSDCDVISETPEGYGFAEVAKKIAAPLKVHPRQFGGPGRSPGDTLLFPFDFKLADSP